MAVYPCGLWVGPLDTNGRMSNKRVNSVDRRPSTAAASRGAKERGVAASRSIATKYKLSNLT
eukprot:scaffold50665_cov30-Tisochrysis_lutea.AAC.3